MSINKTTSDGIQQLFHDLEKVDSFLSQARYDSAIAALQEHDRHLKEYFNRKPSEPELEVLKDLARSQEVLLKKFKILHLEATEYLQNFRKSHTAASAYQSSRNY